MFSGCSEDDEITSSPQPKELTGVFLDSPVEGLYYESETFSGNTDANGEFSYLEGEMVTFFVGDIEIGSAMGQDEITPLSIASTPEATLETMEVKNIAAFLQTLDSDSDPSNGILIESTTVEAISIGEINFSEPIIQILGEIVAEVNLKNDSNLSVVYPENAVEHLAENLDQDYQANPFLNNFISYLENQYGYMLNSYYWIHKTDDEGKLVKSYHYEKYPNRLAFEITYNEYDEDGYPVAFTEILYGRENGEEVRQSAVNVSYAENASVSNSVYEVITYDSWIEKWYKEFDEENRVLKYVFSREPETEPSTQVEYSYDEMGNKLEEKSIRIETGEVNRTVVYTYTDWGDIASETLLNSSGNEIARLENYYREDRTLEKQVMTNSFGGSTTTNYDENEIRISD